MKTYKIKNQRWINDRYYNDFIEIINTNKIPDTFLIFCNNFNIDIENLFEVVISYKDEECSLIDVGHADIANTHNLSFDKQVFFNSYYQISMEIQSFRQKDDRIVIVFRSV